MSIEEKRIAAKRKLAKEKLASAKPIEQPQVVEQERGFMDVVSGRDLMTPEMESLSEIGAAPELNEFSLSALKSSFGLLSTGDDRELRGILKKQLGDDVTFSQDSMGNTIVNLPSGQYAMNKPGLSGQDVVRGLFDLSAFTPSGWARTIPQAVTRSAATEAAIEAGEAAVGGEFDTGEVVGSGLLGGAGKGLEDIVGTTYRAMQGTPASEVVEAGRDAGIPVMTSDVFPPETFVAKTVSQTGEKIPLAGTGGMRAEQQELRQQALDELTDKYSVFSDEAIIKSLKDQKSRVKSAAGGVLEFSGNKLDEIGEIPLTNTRSAMEDAAVVLTKKGVLGGDQALDDLGALMQTLNEAPQTFSTLKQNNTAFREMVNSMDSATRSQLSSREKGILTSVQQAMKSDMDDFAKANLTPKEYSQWKKANAIYAEEAQKLTKTRLKNVLDKGDVTPEAVHTMLFSQKPSELSLLYKSLTNEGRQNARAAFINKLVENTAKRTSGTTPNSFATELTKYPNQVKILFKGNERKQLEGLSRVLSATRRAQDSSVATPTGQQLWPLLTGAGLVADPVTTVGAAGTLGGAARLYESAPVRDALLRLASVPKGSTQFEKYLAEASAALRSAAQASREGAQETETTVEVVEE